MPQKTIDLRIRKPHATQQYVKDRLKRFNVLRCGRRWGKTALSLDFFLDDMLQGYPVAFGSPTYKMLGDVWRAFKEYLYPIIESKNESEKRIKLVTGGVIDFWSLDSPDNVRGREYKGFFIDEGAMIKNLLGITNQIIMPTLIDHQGGMIIASTPKGNNDFNKIDLLSETSDDWASFHFTTYDNPLIPKEEIDHIVAAMTPRYAKQEIFAEYLDDTEYALFRYKNIQGNRVAKAPVDMQRIVVAIDPAVTSTDKSDETGIITAGKTIEYRDGVQEEHYYILGDASNIYTPLGWADASIDQYRIWSADRIVGEKNNGGDLVESNIRNVDRAVSYKGVWASRGKAIRAEPVAALYEQDLVHHVGVFQELETELTTWTPLDSKSPNRLDALVWAITELMGKSVRKRKAQQAAYI